MTRNGIEYNLDITPYIKEVKYKNITIIYKFSSELYLDKFTEYKNNMDLKNKTIDNNKKKYGFGFIIEEMEDISKYLKIEKRGFNLVINEVVYREKDNIPFDIQFNIKEV